jgi:anaphase-promoting complex subunit 8
MVCACVYVLILILTRAAELLNSLPSTVEDHGSDTDVDSPMSDEPPPPHTPNLVPRDAAEVRLEAREAHKYLLAKTYFDCREYDRCAAVFLPGPLPKGPAHVTPLSSPVAKTKNAVGAGAKAKAKTGTPTKATSPAASVVAGLSQKSLFLALYAKYIAGEKRMNEDSEMILGPQDGGVTLNKELPAISAILEEWFNALPASARQPQGWLEYLYGIVLAKGKNDKVALDYLIKSLHYYPYNWGAWQELMSLLGTPEPHGLHLPRLRIAGAVLGPRADSHFAVSDPFHLPCLGLFEDPARFVALPQQGL